MLRKVCPLSPLPFVLFAILIVRIVDSDPRRNDTTSGTQFVFHFFSNIWPVSRVRTVPRLPGGVSAGGCRGGRPRCTWIATTGGVSAMTRVEPREAPVGFVPEVTLRPEFKFLQRLVMQLVAGVV